MENLNQDFFIQQEKRIRKRWFISFIIFYLVNIVSVMLSSLFFMIILLIVQALITHHCSYNKKGTKWLMWVLITVPLGFVRELEGIQEDIINLIYEQNYLGLSILLLFLAITLSILINYLYWCYQLRQINLKIKNGQRIDSKIKKIIGL